MATNDAENWARVHESLGEFRAVLHAVEDWLQRMCKEFDEHIQDHKTAIAKAEEAQATAKQAATLAAISNRSDRRQMWAAYVGIGLATVLAIADIVTRLRQ